MTNDDVVNTSNDVVDTSDDVVDRFSKCGEGFFVEVSRVYNRDGGLRDVP